MQNYQNDSPINNTDSLFDFVFIDADKENLIILIGLYQW